MFLKLFDFRLHECRRVHEVIFIFGYFRRVEFFIRGLVTFSGFPAEEKVTFTDIVAECDGKDCRSKIVWSAKVKDANCNMAAHIAAGGSEISITWDTSAPSKYDNMTAAELYDLNMHGAWARNLQLERPE